MNTQKSETKFLQKIEETFGNDCTIVMGDWSIGKQMRNFISTPMIGLKRKIAKKFTVYNIWEFRTSCLHHETEELCDNLYYEDKKGKTRKLHSLNVSN